MCPARCLAGMMVLWVAALVPKSENDVRIWYKPIHLNPAGLPVGAVSTATGMAYQDGEVLVVPLEVLKN